MPELIVALDCESAEDAIRMVESLGNPGWVKVGSVLYVREGPDVVRELRKRGVSVFLDLKWHDIPNTVRGAVTAARNLDVQMATVHAVGGPEMIEAAVDASGSMDIVAVTVLTSHTADAIARNWGRSSIDPVEEVARLAGLAVAAGAQGVVCSPNELGALAHLGPDTLRVVPGVRPGGSDAGDQKRIATPAIAVRDGASHLVVGRPIIGAPDPAEAYARIKSEMETAVAQTG